MIDIPPYLMGPEDESGGGGEPAAEPAPSPTEIVPEPAETVAEPAPDPTPVETPSAAWLDNDAQYNLEDGGAPLAMNGQQYSYLAAEGLKALRAAAQAENAAAEAGATPEPEADVNDPMTHIKALEQRIEELSGQHRQTNVNIETQRLTSIVDTLAKNSKVVQVLKADGATDDVESLKEEAFSLAARRGIEVGKAFEQVESRYERMATRANKGYLEGKLAEMANATPSGGGKAKPPMKPLTYKEMKADPMAARRRTEQMLSSS
jgi:hypothetical protein